ncbi:MAG: ATPase, partial [Bacteroidetes bacterium 4484_249]
MKNIIKHIIIRFQESNLPETTTRNTELPVDSNKIISVIGSRRCGKTYLIYDTIKKIINSGIPKKNILYINFEDERLQLKTSELDLILQAWRELHNGDELSNHYFFFDEIQNINGWEKFIRRIYDNETKNIYITGSNSNFLSTEIATSLRGRSIPFEIFPFSFDEYLRFKSIKTDYYSEKNKAIIINQFNNYLEMGGYPETIDNDPIRQNEILRTYYYVMLYKDLIERYNIPSAKVIKYFIEKLADNMTKHFSIN